MTLEDVYKALGCSQPFDGSGKLTEAGVAAHKVLAVILSSISEMGIVRSWSEDKLDEIEDSC